MLSLGGLFLALFFGDVILGWDQSQPVGMTDCRDKPVRSLSALSWISRITISEGINKKKIKVWKLLPGLEVFERDGFRKFSKAAAEGWKFFFLHTAQIKMNSFD